MLGIGFRVKYKDGTERAITTTPRDEVGFERQFDMGVMELVESGPDGSLTFGRVREEYLYWLAWAGLHREGVEPRDFDSFLDVVADLDLDLDDEPVNPTRPATQAG